MIKFRVHFVGGDTVDINAGSAAEARKLALVGNSDRVISKIKVVKGD